VSAEQNQRTEGTVASFEMANFSYADGQQRDAEALFVNDAGTLWLFDKDEHETSLFRGQFDRGLMPGAELRRVAVRSDISQVTGADLAPDGRHFLLRNHERAYEFALSQTQGVASSFAHLGYEVDLKQDRRGEAIAYATDARSFFTLSEGKHQPIYQYERTPTCL
jgi:hypothetical protein